LLLKASTKRANQKDQELRESALNIRRHRQASAGVTRRLARSHHGLVWRGIASGEFAGIEANIAAFCVTGAIMEALVGPLASEADPNSEAAKATARSIAALSRECRCSMPRRSWRREI
jgi:hypothetical protein